VKTLIDETIQAGDHSVIWNGNDDFGERVSSGIYFYKIKNSSREIVKKMVLIK
jgi:flagellar hook assembly protein FlgD